MSSINRHFTFQYSQPEEYHFSHDSVFMAREVFERVSTADLSSFEVLDLCSGCGIIGLDFLFHLRMAGHTLPSRVDFLDVQDVYAEHFSENAQQITGTQMRFVNENYSSLLDGHRKYDLILCNPPYFRPGQGGMSPSEFKNRCRFFLDADFATLLNAIASSLKPSGRAFVLLRDLSEQGVDVEAEAEALLSPRARIFRTGDIRGTPLAEITLCLRTQSF